MGVAGSLFGQLGDLSFSVVKREFGIKDYGTIFPGHGGVLDRFDSVLFVAPAYMLYMFIFMA
jgi:phosphatidate cytidylyltransferase